MKWVGWILWIALVVTIGAYFIVTNLEALPQSFPELWNLFLQLPLRIHIIIGLIIWLISVIVPGMVWERLFVRKMEEGQEFGYMAFLFIWPPAWPLGIILLLVILIGNLRSRYRK